MEDGVDACEAVILWALCVFCRRVEALLELGVGFGRCWSLERRVFLREVVPGRLIDCPKRGGTQWCKETAPRIRRSIRLDGEGKARFSKDADPRAEGWMESK